MKYRVIYYTMAGCRSKDFDNYDDAKAMYDRHVKKHPEYQNCSWSKTELITLDNN